MRHIALNFFSITRPFPRSHGRFYTTTRSRVVSEFYPLSAEHLIKEDRQIASLWTPPHSASLNLQWEHAWSWKASQPDSSTWDRTANQRETLLQTQDRNSSIASPRTPIDLNVTRIYYLSILTVKIIHHHMVCPIFSVEGNIQSRWIQYNKEVTLPHIPRE
jgi:hypothetical protein